MLILPALNQFEIVTLKSGVKSLRSLERKETFHPGVGPAVEAKILYVDQQRLVERAASSAASVSVPFIIWDIGFGAGANVLTAIEALKGCTREVEIHSFDKTTAPIEFALSHSEDLTYIRGHEDQVRRLLSEREIEISPKIRWRFHLADFSTEVRDLRLASPHAIFYDPYSPTGNPEMWSLEHFKFLYGCLNAASPCLLTNYTRSTMVRVTLLLAGFYVGIGCSVHEKAETTIASNSLAMLDRPLDRKWLERVKISRNSAPLRLASYSQATISPEDLKALEALPQFR